MSTSPGPVALPHKWRLYAILIVTVLDLAAVIAARFGVVPELLDEIRPQVETALYVVLALALPALADAYLVERRRRDPSVPALPDDVKPVETAVPTPSKAKPWNLLVFLAGLVFITSGCGGPPAAVQTSLTTTARAVVAIDDELAPAYGAAADDCRTASISWDAYDACLADWETARTALGVTHRSLLSAQAAHDAWADGSEDGTKFASVVPCLARAVGQALAALELVGIEPPDIISEALALVSAFGGTCRE
jgi:hypothetical protein